MSPFAPGTPDRNTGFFRSPYWVVQTILMFFVVAGKGPKRGPPLDRGGGCVRHRVQTTTNETFTLAFVPEPPPQSYSWSPGLRDTESKEKIFYSY